MEIHSASTITLLDVEKKKIFKGALIILLLGILMLLVELLLYAVEVSALLCIIPILYMLSGIIGGYASKNQSSLAVSAYLFFLIILFGMNLLIIIGCICGIIYYYYNPSECNHDDCLVQGSYNDFIFPFLGIAIGLSSIKLIILCIIIKHVKNYKKNESILEELSGSESSHLSLIRLTK